MKRMFMLVLLGACGSKAPPAATPKPANEGSAAAPGGHWDVLVKGASWKLLGEEFDPPSVTVTVADVVPRDGGREIRLSWSDEGGPETLFVGPRGVFVGDTLVVDEPPKVIEEQTLPDGRYVRMDTNAGERVICFGFGPAPDAGECEDVCFQEMCVAEKSGIVQLSGTWAPGYAFYAQAGY